jgi:hypothetical protein
MLKKHKSKIVRKRERQTEKERKRGNEKRGFIA